jgi:REP element-mobilizing transposase RayT
MPEKFLNKFRIPSARLPQWDYKNTGAYFITICTHNREHYFGEIEDEKMQLSSIGKIVETEWLKTPEIRPDMNLKLDEFVVMPNHFHGILIIGDNKFNKPIRGGIDDGRGSGDAMHGISTTPIITAPFAWQPRFHDHIIRDLESYHRIQQYIINNPLNWKEDKFCEGK